jgi:hypothetical protein
MNFYDSGFTIFHSSAVSLQIDKINSLLASLLGIDINAPDFFDEVHGELVELFVDQEAYFGFLKAFTNSPIVQEISASPDLMTAISNSGVIYPTLVTPPILHIVARDLIVNEDKVFTPAHQDVISTKGSVGQLVVWIPLHEVSVDNFGINAIPGSHKLGTLDTDPSAFGHTVKPELISDMTSEYIPLNKGDSLIFSQYLVHHTHKIGKFRMALSFRFNDMSDVHWQKRKYFVPFERTAVTKEYEDNRQLAPIRNLHYFNRG